MISNYVDLDLILERVNTIKIPGQTYNIAEVKEWVYQALSKIGTNKGFIETSIPVEIKEGKGIIPKEIHTIQTITEIDSGYNMDALSINDNFRPLTYRLNNGFIFTDFKNGGVVFNCKVFPVDEEGRPLIPDTEEYIVAVTSYIRLKLGERLYWQDKIGDRKLQRLEKDWLLDCPNAKASANMYSEDELNNLKKNLLKPIPNFYRNSPYG